MLKPSRCMLAAVILWPDVRGIRKPFGRPGTLSIQDSLGQGPLRWRHYRRRRPNRHRFPPRYRWRHDRKRRSIRHRLPPRSASHRRRSRVYRPLPEMPSRAVVQGGASFVAHLASFKIKDKANQFMHTVTKKYDLGGKSVRVNKVKIAKKGTWYRVVVGTFSSLQDAIIFCQQAGKFNADCEVLNKGGNAVASVSMIAADAKSRPASSP